MDLCHSGRTDKVETSDVDLCHSDILEIAIYVQKQIMYELDQRISDMVTTSDVDLCPSGKIDKV